MRDVFWPSIIPITKQEIIAKGLLPCLTADAPRKDKDECVLCSIVDEGADCIDSDSNRFDLCFADTICSYFEDTIKREKDNSL
jgi:hypothetical protein